MIWQKLNQPQPKIKFKPQIILIIISFILAVGMPISISHKIPALAITEKTYEKKLFETALSFTLYFEGGFSNHPADKGGSWSQFWCILVLNFFDSHITCQHMISYQTNEQTKKLESAGLF